MRKKRAQAPWGGLFAGKVRMCCVGVVWWGGYLRFRRCSLVLAPMVGGVSAERVWVGVFVHVNGDAASLWSKLVVFAVADRACVDTVGCQAILEDKPSQKTVRNISGECCNATEIAGGEMIGE